MILSLYRYILQHPWLIILCIVAQVVGGQLFLREIQSASQSLACQEHECIPDLMLGWPFDLNQLYAMWTPELHQAYVRGTVIDFAVIMPGFTLTLGSLLLLSAQRLHCSEHLAHLATLAFLSDVAETYISRHGSLMYPRRLPDGLVGMASLAGQCKWITIYFAVLVVVGSFALKRRTKATAKLA